MSHERPLLHSLARIAEPPYVLNWRTDRIMYDEPISRKLAAPLIDARLYGAAITQRHNYDSKEYTSETYSFTMLLRGTLKLRLNGKEHKMNPGDIACAPPGTNFRRWTEGHTWWVYIDFEDHEFWRPLKDLGPYCREHESPDLIYILLQHLMDMRASCENLPTNGVESPLRTTQLLNEFTPRAAEYSRMLLKLFRQECIVAVRGQGDQKSRLQALIQQIRLSPHQDWNVESMSRHLNVSIRTLRRLTHQEYNMAPLQIVIQARIDEAVRLMRKPENTIEAIAHHVGYESVFSFSRLFSKHMGMAPGKYRRHMLGHR